MELKATTRTATFAGIWTAMTAVPFSAWMEQHLPKSVLLGNLLWIAGIAVCLLVPCYYFVIGRESGPFSRMWFADPEQRSRYAIVAKRMLLWFLSAAATGILWSLALMLIWPRP